MKEPSTQHFEARYAMSIGQLEKIARFWRYTPAFTLS
jgi:hypothetical protein